ncbi:MAG: hypothetical protein JO278_03990 [Dyella sp.]|nr:hypothetical protein [Dyella sp.]MBV8272657.1 hypothetical protein [Cupriavidus sp.]
MNRWSLAVGSLILGGATLNASAQSNVEAPAATEAPASTAAPPASPHTFTANVALVSDYRYRGLTQTNRRPAIQGGFDYSHESGFYVGNWNSTISWISDADKSVSAPVEMDFYGGFKNTFKASGLEFNYDVGVLEYFYPGGYTQPRPYTTELYAGIGYGPVFLKYSQALTNLFGIANSQYSSYIDLAVNYPLNVWGLTLNAHLGYQSVQHNSVASYLDWKLGLTKDLGRGFAVAVAYIGTNAKELFYTNSYNHNVGNNTAWISLSKTF